MKMKLRWKWNLSKRFSPKIYSYTVYTLMRVKKDKDFQFLATCELEKIILPTSFIYFKQKSHPPRLLHTSLLFFIWKFSSFYYYSSHPYYFGTESNSYFWGGVKSSTRLDSRTSAFKRSDWKSSIKPKTLSRRRLFIYDNKWSKCSS